LSAKRLQLCGGGGVTLPLDFILQNSRAASHDRDDPLLDLNFFHRPTIIGIANLGFPDFFRVELGVLQLLAAVLLIVPLPFPQIKEWAYAGAALFYLTAIIAHVAHRDSHLITAINLGMLVVLFASNYFFQRLHLQ
jgi:hypothetical protein